MKKKWGKIIGIAGICLVLILTMTGAYLFFGRQSLSKAAPGEKGSSWMEEADGTLLLNELTIPGAHDSSAWNSDFSYFSQCQYVDTISQLKMGVRYLDIRISLDKEKEKLIMTHSIATCREGEKPLGTVLTLDRVLDDCYGFLEENPSETIIFCVKPEDDQSLCKELFLEKLAEKPELWYVENRMPSLEEARGKLVLASRFSEEYSLDNGMSLQWPQQDNTEPIEEPFSAGKVNEETSLYVQDRYCYDMEDKWEAIRHGMEEKQKDIQGENALLLQFLSTKGTGWQGHPYKYAKELNQRFLDMEFTKCTNYGWIIVDFAEPKLIEYIYKTNFIN